MPYFPCPYFFNFSEPEMYRTDMPMEGDLYSYPQNLPGALELIKEAVAGEREDELFYDYLISVAPDEEAKNIIRGIRDDENKHNKMFKKIFKTLTGQPVPPAAGEEFQKPRTYCDGVKKALLGELTAVQKYRKILFAMQNRVMINMVTEIITDELRHGNLYNLLFSLGRCSEER